MPLFSPDLSKAPFSGLLGARRQAIVYGDVARTNVTGDGTAYVPQLNAAYSDPSARWNVSTFTYTAQEDGVFLVSVALRLSGVAAGHTTGVLDLVTTARSYRFACNPAQLRDGGNLATIETTGIVPLSASNTLSFSLTVSGSTKTINLDGAAAGGPAVSYASIIRIA
jgi:hypothetical protein